MTPLLPGLRPATLADVPGVLALFDRCDTVEFGSPQMDAAQIAGPLATPGTEAVAVQEAGGLVGFASLAANGEAESLAEPGREDLHDALLAWVLDRARDRGVPRLEHWAGPRPDGLAAGPLRRAGFLHVRTVWHLARDAGPSSEPVWPEGVRLRPFVRERDAEEVHALVQRAFAGTFGSHLRPFQEWAGLVLDTGSDVLCAEEDGALVAVATHSRHRGDGHVGQLAVDAPHRGRGLALALLHEAFRRDTAAGRPRTSLGVDGENDGARRLYDKAGMQVVQEFHRWERDV